MEEETERWNSFPTTLQGHKLVFGRSRNQTPLGYLQDSKETVVSPVINRADCSKSALVNILCWPEVKGITDFE